MGLAEVGHASGTGGGARCRVLAGAQLTILWLVVGVFGDEECLERW
jgi:hypothetical protein